MSDGLAQPLIREFAHELPPTRALLESMPDGRFEWRPHERSMSLGRLGSHLVEIVRYGSLVLAADSLDSTRRSRGPLDLASTEELLATLDSYATALLSALERADDALLLGRWSYTKGDRVIFEVRRLQALRTFVLNHWYHHRGQLTVYLRQLDIPLPQVYGPSADDSTGY